MHRPLSRIASSLFVVIVAALGALACSAPSSAALVRGQDEFLPAEAGVSPDASATNVGTSTSDASTSGASAPGASSNGGGTSTSGASSNGGSAPPHGDMDPGTAWPPAGRLVLAVGDPAVGRTLGCLDLKDGVAADGAPVRLWACAPLPNENQLWAWDGVTLKTGGGRCLEARGAAVGTWACTGAPEQTWKLSALGPAENGGGLCLEVQDGATGDGASLHMAACTGAPLQTWTTGVFLTATVDTDDDTSVVDAGPPAAGSGRVLALGDSITNGYTCGFAPGGKP